FLMTPSDSQAEFGIIIRQSVDILETQDVGILHMQKIGGQYFQYSSVLKDNGWIKPNDTDGYEMMGTSPLTYYADQKTFNNGNVIRVWARNQEIYYQLKVGDNDFSYEQKISPDII